MELAQARSRASSPGETPAGDDCQIVSLSQSGGMFRTCPILRLSRFGMSLAAMIFQMLTLSSAAMC